MVSIQNLITVGILAAVAIAIVSLGGFAGVGSKIGGGIKGAASDLFSGFTGGLFSSAGAAGQTGNQSQVGETGILQADQTLTNQSAEIGIPLLEQNLTQTKSTLDQINNFFANLISGSLFNPQAFSTASSFTPEAIAARIAAQEAQAASIAAGSISGSPFGGFQNAASQESALQAAISESKKNFPSFFK